MMLRFLDAGESHGKGVVTIIEGIPYGIMVSEADIARELKRRRQGYGRSSRMQLEEDRAEIMSGVRYGITIGSPVTISVANSEYEKWKRKMSLERVDGEGALTMLRPGHADLAGVLKYGTHDVRDVLERASARETVGRVCAGAVAKRLLDGLGIAVRSHVIAIGGIRTKNEGTVPSRDEMLGADTDPLRCLDEDASRLMREKIDGAREKGDSLGGIFEVVAYGLCAGLGSHVHWDRRLDARLAAAVMSIQAVKGVELGDGFRISGMRGSEAADVIVHEVNNGFHHLTNHAGGLEGGMTNGEELVVRAAMKPIPTLAEPLDSVDLASKEKVKAAVERADVCAVPSAAVIAESVVAFVIADALLEKTGGDNMQEVKARYGDIIAQQAGF